MTELISLLLLMYILDLLMLLVHVTVLLLMYLMNAAVIGAYYNCVSFICHSFDYLLLLHLFDQGDRSFASLLTLNIPCISTTYSNHLFMFSCCVSFDLLQLLMPASNVYRLFTASLIICFCVIC